ncbi:MAG: IclR family transcriptional regulator [Clostridiaceae bacterium]
MIKKDAAHVKSIERALLLVEALAVEPREHSLTELSVELGWPKSTVHGVLSTLVQYRYVEQSEETGRYRLGVRFFELGVKVGRMWDIRSIAMPYMQKLNAELGEMVQLCTEDHGEILYLEKLDSNHLIRIVSEIGGRLPLHCTGLGKAMLAFMPPAKVKQIIREHGLTGYTPNTITSPALLEREMEKIREQGYAIDEGEIMLGLYCVAAPIFDGKGQVKYALSVSGMQNNFDGAKLERMKNRVVEAAGAISKTLKSTSI